MAAKFVGRDKELAALEDHLGSALAGRGNVLFVSADPGAGKTTLTRHFLDRTAAAHPDALIIRAGCSEQFGPGEPYQPFVEAFRHLLRERDQASRRHRSLRDLARQLAPYWVAAIPVAGEVLAASWQTASRLRQEFGKGGAAAPSEEALFFQYTELFLAAAAETPVVLFLDDLHWADRSTIALLTHLGRRISDQRVLILGTWRPAEVNSGQHPMRAARQELERYGVAREIALGPLDTRALADLVLLHTGAVPGPELFEWLHRRAGSNALFFEELLRWLVGQQLTRENLGELQLVRLPQEIEVPRSAESTIEKRLDRLDPEVRRVLEYASVQGTEFDSAGLSRLLGMDELDLEETLEPLARVHGLITVHGTRDLPGGDVASVYRFAHSLIQDVLHHTLQGKRRILLHRRMAEILEELHGPDADPARLAVHFEEGRHAEKAFDYALRAADHASHLHAHWDAIEQIERALRVAPTPDRRAAANERLGESLTSVGRYAEALIAFDNALEDLPADADSDRLRVRRRHISVEVTQGIRSLDDLLPELHSLLAEAERLQIPIEQCRILWQLIDLPGTTESMDITLARAALDIATPTGDVAIIARGHEVLGLALTFGSDPAVAMAEMHAAARLYAEAGDAAREAACRSNLSLTRVLLGEFETAAEEFEQVTRIFDEIADPMRAAATRSNLGAILRILGRYDDAERYLTEAVRISKRLALPARMLSPLMNLAELFESRGEWNAAEKQWTEMLRVAMDTGYAAEQMIAHCGIGTARLRLGNMDGAVAAERAARRTLSGDPDLLGDSGNALQLFSARLAAAAAEVDGAVAILDQLIDAVDGRDRYLTAVYLLERADVLARTAPATAVEDARRSASELRMLGALPDAERADALLRHLQASPPSPQPAL